VDSHLLVTSMAADFERLAAALFAELEATFLS
jgi:hypothetical protein